MHIYTVSSKTYRRPRILEDLEPPRRSVRGGGIVNGGEVPLDGPEVVTPDSLVGARPVSGLLVHLDGDDCAGSDGALASHTGGAAGVAAEVVGGYVRHG